MNAGPQKFLRPSQPGKRRLEKPLKMGQVIRNAVGNISLKMVPDELIGIKLRSVSRKPVDMETAVSCKEIPDRGAFMLRARIPKHGHVPLKMARQLAQECSGLARTDVFIRMEAGIKRDLSSFGRNGQGRDGRNLAPAPSHFERRGLSADRPGSSDMRDQKKPRLVEKNEMSLKPFGLFLYEARPNASSGRWPSRLFPGPSSGASGSSSQDGSGTAINDWRDNEPRIPWRSPGRSFFGSRGPWRIPRPGGLSRAFWSASFFASHSAWGACRRRAWTSSLPAPLSGKIPSKGTPNSPSIRFCRRPRTISLPSAAIRRPAGAAVRAAAVCHKVSCIEDAIFSIRFSITYA